MGVDETHDEYALYAEIVALALPIASSRRRLPTHGCTGRARRLSLSRLPLVSARVLPAPQRAPRRLLAARLFAGYGLAVAQLPQAGHGRRPQPHAQHGASLRRG